MLTRECKARIRQEKAMTFEQEKKFKLASSFYLMTKELWSKISGSKRSQNFCEARSKHCDYMSTTVDHDDDDELI